MGESVTETGDITASASRSFCSRGRIFAQVFGHHRVFHPGFPAHITLRTQCGLLMVNFEKLLANLASFKSDSL